MKNKKISEFDRDYLRRCKASTPEQKLDWLAAAQEFVQATKQENPKSGRREM